MLIQQLSSPSRKREEYEYRSRAGSVGFEHALGRRICRWIRAAQLLPSLVQTLSRLWIVATYSKLHKSSRNSTHIQWAYVCIETQDEPDFDGVALTRLFSRIILLAEYDTQSTSKKIQVKLVILCQRDRTDLRQSIDTVVRYRLFRERVAVHVLH